MNCRITERFFEVMDLLREEQKQVKDYGTGIKVNHIESIFLDTVFQNPNANVSVLAKKLGITKGAVTQAYSKLSEKDLIKMVRRPDNKKEKYFELTAAGEAVRVGHQQYHEQANANLCNYLCGLDQKETETIMDFLEHLKECVPFCDFICREGNGQQKEEQNETSNVNNKRFTCSAGSGSGDFKRT